MIEFLDNHIYLFTFLWGFATGTIAGGLAVAFFCGAKSKTDNLREMQMRALLAGRKNPEA